MIATTALRRASPVVYSNVRAFSSAGSTNIGVPDRKKEKQQRREVHSTPRDEQKGDSALRSSSSVAYDASAKDTFASAVLKRFVVTAEVTVSKLFPAGFAWQSASLFAENQMGFSPETLNFALTTGLGDAVGVMVGHTAYYAAKKAALGRENINLTRELQTGALLGSAAFCSGTAWQPTVNLLQGMELSFGQVFAGTWIGCGAAFYAGLRVFRTVLSGPFQYVEEPTYENSKKDASLSVAIGGATGFFVGTDTGYFPEQNFLIDVVGIHDGVPDLKGCAIAGSSTALGFMTAQSAMNIVYPKNKCWND